MLKARIVFKEGSIADIGNIETIYINTDSGKTIEVKEAGDVQISDRKPEEKE